VNTIVSKADLDDRRWLAQQVATLGDGIEAARDIWLNWTENRNVSRFHPGQSCGDFIASQLGGVRLDLPRLIAALPDMSNREIAKVAGVDEGTIRNRKKEGAEYSAPEPAEPARVIGADGKSYPGRVVGTTTAEVIEPEGMAEANPALRNPRAALARSFERELRRLSEEYGELRGTGRLGAKYEPVFAAIAALLEK
jgi:hypothetical protein